VQTEISPEIVTNSCQVLIVEFLCWSTACNIHNTVAVASIYQEILWLVFDLIFAVSSVVLVRILWLLEAEHFISELTNVELIITFSNIIVPI